METFITLTENQNVTLQLIRGYRDDFDADLGWTVSGDATEGQWIRGIPHRQDLFDMWQCASDTDSPFDQGDFAYSTGLSASADVINDEVSGGTTWLSSPGMDLDSIEVAHISFDYWLCEFPPNQYLGLTVWLTNGEDTSLLAELTNPDIAGSWQRQLYIIDQWNGPKDNVRILFSARDTTPGPGEYFLKVHIDNFNLIDELVSTGDEWDHEKLFVIYPNPVDGPQIFLKQENSIEANEMMLNIFDTYGRMISSRSISIAEAVNGIKHDLSDGAYFVKWITDQGESGVEKIVVLKK
jgi:hypothetical protein